MFYAFAKILRESYESLMNVLGMFCDCFGVVRLSLYLYIKNFTK